ncbi:reverse transcriptase [Gossypium australe]|uniref:Reverse transcriptase n=1 Tax=Gossypium australe TaxID=47621 RepID=A0A5B6VJA0_9ROSI|nr:reverse transcriptase [Gossypium australe]
MSKVLAQSAFIPRRLIKNNIILAYEILNVFQRKSRGTKCHFALKLDMNKAYNRVEWDFLKQMMLKMGFSNRWVNILLHCVRSVTYLVTMNREVGRQFSPRRGLRQGDPFSLYLFLIYCEGLSPFMQQALHDNMVRGLRLAAKAHRFRTCYSRMIVYFLRRPRLGYVNFDKFIVYLNTNVEESLVPFISTCLRIQIYTELEKYLGLPNMVGRAKQQVFQGLKDCMHSRIENWCARPLFIGGKENGGRGGMHWCAWPKLCHLKPDGGLGSRIWQSLILLC